MNTDNNGNLPVEIDEAKRETLRKLAQAAWTVPLVATFSLSSLNLSSAWANGNGSSTHS